LPRAERLLLVLWNPSIYPKLAVLAIRGLGQEWRWIGSRFRVGPKPCAMGLSWASAADPAEGKSPASLSRPTNSTGTYTTTI
jgi:hypothetical protein